MNHEARQMQRQVPGGMQVQVPLQPETSSNMGGAVFVLVAAAAGGLAGGALVALTAGLMALTLFLASAGQTTASPVGRFDTGERLFSGPGYRAYRAFDRQTRRQCTLVVGYPVGGRSDGPSADVARSLDAGAYDRGATRDGQPFWAMGG